MTATLALLLLVVALMLRRNGHCVRYLTFALAVSAALIWAISFDFIVGKDAVTDAVTHKRFLLLSIVGSATALAGLIASIWCSDRAIRYVSRSFATLALVMCASGFLTPY
jgi:Zn-dependent protease